MKYTVAQLLNIHGNQGSILLLTVAPHKPTYVNLLLYMEHVDNWKLLGTHLLPEKYIPHLLMKLIGHIKAMLVIVEELCFQNT